MKFFSSIDPLPQARAALGKLLETYRSSPILFLVSGGSAFGLLEGVSPDLLGPHMTLGVLDERYSIDETVSNFSQLAKTDFFKMAQQAGVPMIDTRVRAKEMLGGLATRFQEELQLWRNTNPSGVIIATLGMGRDGHTAGIMPDMPKTQSWILGYDAGPTCRYPMRVTATFEFLRLIDHAVAYCRGVEKQAVFDHFTAWEGSLRKISARIFYEMKDVALFTDLRYTETIYETGKFTNKNIS